MKDGFYYVYILKCNDGTYYTGVTNDLDRRLAEHQNGYNRKSYTHFRRPVTLVYSEGFKYINNAIAREKQLKKWSVKKKMTLFSLRSK